MTKTEIFNNAISVAVLKHHEDISKQSIFVSESFANHLLDDGQCFKHCDKLLFFRLNINVIVSKDLKRNIVILSSKQVADGICMLMRVGQLNKIGLMPKLIYINENIDVPVSCLDRKIMEGRG